MKFRYTKNAPASCDCVHGGKIWATNNINQGKNGATFYLHEAAEMNDEDEDSEEPA